MASLPFSGRVAIVTGASKGIGHTTALALARGGARVVVGGREQSTVCAAVEEIRSAGGSAIAGVADLRDPEAIRSMVAACMQHFGRVDLLINNAGGGGFVTARYLEDSNEAEWADLLAVNLLGTLHCCKAVIPIMKAQGSGKIVNLSSSGGRSRARLSNPVYCAAKAAIDGLTRQLAADLGPWGINVNAVAPGTTRSDRVEQRFQQMPAADREAILSAIPLQNRLAEVDEVVAPLLFLASDQASYITGITLDVNGGFYMG